jgi:ferritin-like metal-binding protein YciE
MAGALEQERARASHVAGMIKIPEATMQINSFQDMYVAELQELHSSERELEKALPRFAGGANHDVLKAAFNAQRTESRQFEQRLNELLQRYSTPPLEHVDQAMQALLSESERWRLILKDPNLADAGLIDSMQRILHYQIAAYGTITALAGQLGRAAEKSVLHEILEAKKSLDQRLTDIAKSTVNQDAVTA